MPEVAVAGGSLGGLVAALLLRDAGCPVTIYERSSSIPNDRGAGIALLEQTLRYPAERLGVRADAISTSTAWVRFLERDGQTVYSAPQSHRFSTWSIIHRVLYDAFPNEHYKRGRELTAFNTQERRVRMEFTDGTTEEAELLICADGIGSASRARIAPYPAVKYAGYVAWRGTVSEVDVSRATCELLQDAITYQVMPYSHILAYPIPGTDGAVKPGRRRFNLVWYQTVPPKELPRILTGRDGVTRPQSLPPGQVQEGYIEAMRGSAGKVLARPLAELVSAVASPFVQAVFDIGVTRLNSGRACLLGDAAFAVRPHAAASSAKAAEDGWVLAEELLAAQGDVELAISRWEERQFTLGADLLARARSLGDSLQSSAGFRPGDPRLAFGLYGPSSQR